MASEFTSIIEKISRAVNSEKSMKLALSTVLSVHKPRIFERGQAENGSQIGSYSTNPISISKSQQARQTGQTYFPGGYSEYKTKVGKNPGYVNLRNTDQMYADYGLVGSLGSFGFGFQNPENYKKSQWMEEKYDKEIFSLSDPEVDLLGNVLVAELAKALS